MGSFPELNFKLEMIKQNSLFTWVKEPYTIYDIFPFLFFISAFS